MSTETLANWLASATELGMLTRDVLESIVPQHLASTERHKLSHHYLLLPALLKRCSTCGVGSDGFPIRDPYPSSGAPLDGFPVKKGVTATHRLGGFLPVVCVKTRQGKPQDRTFRSQLPPLPKIVLLFTPPSTSVFLVITLWISIVDN
jgi:hypothetical protein